MKFNFQNRGLSQFKKQKKFRPTFSIETFIVTFFFVGLIPLAPGTLGTLATYPLYYFITDLSPIESLHFESLKEQVVFLLWASAIFLTIIGTIAITVYQRKTETMDHKSIVIDEVIGMLITLAISFQWLYEISTFLLTFMDWKLRNIMFLVAFVVFRFFDITKPLFIGLVDKHFKKPFGVILDDILAAFFASGVIFVAYLIISSLK